MGVDTADAGTTKLWERGTPPLNPKSATYRSLREKKPESVWEHVDKRALVLMSKRLRQSGGVAAHPHEHAQRTER